MTGDRPKKSHFIVKVNFETLEDKEATEGLKVYNEDYLLYGDILQKYNPSEVKELKDKIKKEGHKAARGFFYAIITKDGVTKKDGVHVVEVKINTSQIQPIEGW